MIATSLTLFAAFAGDMRPRLGNLGVQVWFLPLALIVFSFAQWENFYLTIGAYHLLQAFVFAATLVTVARFFREPTVLSGRCSLLLIAASVLVLTSAYALGLGAAIVMWSVPSLLWERKERNSRQTVAILMVLTGLAACFALYLNGIKLVTHSSVPGTARTTADWMYEPRFFLELIGSSLVANDWLTRNGAALVAGGAAAAIVVTSLALRGRQLFAVRTLVPVTLVLYGATTALLVLVGRSDQGLEAATVSRYATMTQLSLVGAVWLLCVSFGDAEAETSRRRWLTGIAALAVAIVVCGQAFSWSTEWQGADSRRGYFESLRQMAQWPEDFGPAEFRHFQTSLTRDQIIARLAMLKARRLSIYAELSEPGSDLQTAVFNAGWFAPESQGRWMSRQSRVLIRTGHEGRLRIEGYSPLGYAEHLDVQVEGMAPARVDVREQHLALELAVPADKILAVALTCDRSVIPSQSGKGADSRNLSLLVTRLEGR